MWGAPYLKFIAKKEKDLKFGREAHCNIYFWNQINTLEISLLIPECSSVGVYCDVQISIFNVMASVLEGVSLKILFRGISTHFIPVSNNIIEVSQLIDDKLVSIMPAPI